MGFLSNIISATVKTALVPVAIVKDAVNIVTDEVPNTTRDLLESASEDVCEAIDNIVEGEL
jgi:hypothetical protein